MFCFCRAMVCGSQGDVYSCMGSQDPNLDLLGAGSQGGLARYGGGLAADFTSL